MRYNFLSYIINDYIEALATLYPLVKVYMSLEQLQQCKSLLSLVKFLSEKSFWWMVCLQDFNPLSVKFWMGGGTHPAVPLLYTIFSQNFTTP